MRSYQISGSLFQSTLPRGERRKGSRRRMIGRNFNPRSREGSDTAVTTAISNVASNFNPRSREGSDRLLSLTVARSSIFQSTLPRGERPDPWTPARSSTYFNPRSREGSDAAAVVVAHLAFLISIHAPARGATRTIFSHGVHGDEFQSTLPRGERRRQRLDPPRLYRISIHAPARGATEDNAALAIWPRFQSTLPRGERRYSADDMFNMLAFQSTLPRGERREAPRAPTGRSNFNPRSREGSDSRGRGRGQRRHISIHAPARGATRARAEQPRKVLYFNPRSREGSDRYFGTSTPV